jgi:hypothetical protein
MKRLSCFFAAIFFCLTAICQEPKSFNYQATVRNVAGELVRGESVTIHFSILKGSVSGEVVYSEKQTIITSEDGLISLSIGEGTGEIGDIKSINWTSDNYLWSPEKTKKSSALIVEDEMVIVRKYVGKFIDYRHTGYESYGGPNLIWIKTSLEKAYGKISAYGKNCEFSMGDNLYIKRILYTPGGISGYWIYQIENDSSMYYRVSDFQSDKKVFVESWFE